MSPSPVDLSATQAANWKGKLAALSRNDDADSDPRVAECQAGLSFWRIKRAVDREVDAGHISVELADDFITRARMYHPG